MLLRRKPFGPLLPSAHAVDRCTKRYRLSETETMEEMEEMERLTAWLFRDTARAAGAESEEPRHNAGRMIGRSAFA